MKVRPQPRPRPHDVVAARPRPLSTVGLTVVRARGQFYFHAVDGTRSWSGRTDSPNRDTAVLDAVTQILAESPTLGRVRIVVKLDPTSELRRHATELAVLLPGVSLEVPTDADQPLMKAAADGVAADLAPSPSTDLSPVVVATDGSVRGKVTGYGWLASSGDFGLLGFRHSTKQVGPSVVLIAELRAINDAVRRLPYRQLTVLTDSRLALQMLQRWTVGDDVLPDGYTTERRKGTAGLVEAQRRMRLHQNRIDVQWVRAHQGDLLNEGADALAWRPGSPAGTASSPVRSTASAPLVSLSRFPASSAGAAALHRFSVQRNPRGNHAHKYRHHGGDGSLGGSRFGCTSAR